MFHVHTTTGTHNMNREGFPVTSPDLKMKAGSPHAVKVLRTSARRVLLALVTAGTIASVALATPAGASAATRPSAVHATSEISYGEYAQFHCNYGRVTFDYLNVIAGTFSSPTQYWPELYAWYSGAWHFEGYMGSETLYSYYYVPEETPISVSVTPGYDYAVNVYVSSPGHIAHTDHSYVDQGPGAGGHWCMA